MEDDHCASQYDHQRSLEALVVYLVDEDEAHEDSQTRSYVEEEGHCADGENEEVGEEQEG